MAETLAQRPTSVLKAVFFGPESTGKTTLAQMLAEHFNTLWVEEYMREYLQEKWNLEQKVCEPKDMLPIARGQMQRENELAEKANRILFCDTDLLELKVYSEAYYNGFCDPQLLKHALNNRYDLYFLMYIDVPWTPDDLRDKPFDRIGMFKRFEKALILTGKPYVILKGDLEERFQTVVSEINKFLKKRIDVGFSEIDILQIEENGLSSKEVERQIKLFERGNVKVDIQRAATPGNGIFVYSEKEKKDFIALYENKISQLNLLKFVPASGAATRMFKALHNFTDEFDPEQESLRNYLDRKEDPSLQRFFEGIESLPFYDRAFKLVREKYSSLDDKSKDEQHLLLVKTMLYEDGLNLSNLPKGLVPFHKYENRIATAFEEHLYGASKYLSVNGLAKVHFTVAHGDKDKFKNEFEAIKERVEKATNTKFEITYSYQDPKTDTIAVDEDNEPFRDEEGHIFFRPGGHGALIENLNNQEADLIFIKNIDNVVVEKSLGDVVEYKKMLGGKLLQLQEQIFSYLNQLDTGNNSEAKLDEIARFIEKEFSVEITGSFNKFTGEEKTQYLCRKLDKPLRICGMVKNEGEPGGGPFLVKDDTGEVSLQIIEGAQIDKDSMEQLKILNNSTHFNPVDIVCGIYNRKGEKYDLHQYVDERMSFIAHKTKDGKPLKALERPGLWNGGMAFWNTVFVEVPVSTFNPVKTVADLLKPSHRTE